MSVESVHHLHHTPFSIDDRDLSLQNIVREQQISKLPALNAVFSAIDLFAAIAGILPRVKKLDLAVSLISPVDDGRHELEASAMALDEGPGPRKIFRSF